MRYQAVNALPLRNFVSIASGFLLFRVGCAQTLLCVLLYAFSGSERAVPLRNFVSIASGFLLFRVGCAQTLLCVLLYAFSGSERAVPLRNFVSIASGFLLFRGGYAQTLLSVRLYALSGSERTSAPELCQYSIGFSSVSRRMRSDAFMRSALCVLRQ
jgi:hypothetical protein